MTMIFPFAGATLSTIFVFMMTGNKAAYAGYPLAARSIVNLAFQLPVAWWIDQSDSKQRGARIGGIIMLFQIALTQTSIVWTLGHLGNNGTACWSCLYFFLASRAVQGAQGTFINSAQSALVGMSTILGDRTRIISINQQISGGGELASQMLLAVFFWWQGNKWTLPLIGHTMQVGSAMYLTTVISCFLFSDRYAYKDGGGKLKLNEEEQEDKEKVAVTDGPTTAAAQGSEEQQAATPSPQTWGGWVQKRKLPIVMQIGNLVWLVGDGLTQPFWSLMFMNHYKLPPLGVLLIDFIAPFTELTSAILAPLISNRIGRMQTIILAGLLVIIVMVSAGQLLASPEWADVLWPMILLNILRTLGFGLVLPPMQSIYTDVVPSNELARWQAIGTIHAASFAGTAVVGGHLIEQFGYGATFYITALINTVGLAALLPVVYLVPTKEKESKRSTEMI